jgi:serine protease Do
MQLRKFRLVTFVSGVTVAAAVAGGVWLWNAPYARAWEMKETATEARAQLEKAPDLSSAFREVARAVEPSVVSISVHKTVKMTPSEFPFDNPLLRRFFGGQENGGAPDLTPMPGEGRQSRGFEQIGMGSGVIVDAGNGVGYILTNNHVARGATQLDITLADGRKITNGKVVGTDPKTDLALVEIKAENLMPAEWGSSDQLQQGDRVMAFGSPFGYVGSMTHGIVSGLHRQSGILGRSGYEDFIQTDAPINPGNSGGPLVDMHGRIVGINTAITSSSGGFEGIGFAIPADEARHVYTVLKEHGKVVRGWLGVEITDVTKSTDEARSSGYTGDKGVLVTGVLRDAPATGRLMAGDVITQFDGKAINNSMQLREAVARTSPGSEATFQITRDGKSMDVRMKIGEQGGTATVATANESGSTENLGMRLTDPKADDLQKYDLSGESGALVATVEPGSIAARMGVEPGSLITQVGNKKTTDAAEASAALSKVDLSKGVRLFIVDREGTRMLFMQSNG